MSALTFPKKIALRYLYSRRSEAAISILTVIAILGVAIGVIVLNVVMSVMTGFETELKDKILGADSHVTVRSFGGKISNWNDVKKKIETVPGVESASAFTYHQALIQVGDRASGLLIRGIEEKSGSAEQLKKYVKDKEILSRLKSSPDSPDLPGIIIGRELARQMSLVSGTPISLLSPQVGSSPFGLLPHFKRFSVLGTYQSGLVEYEQGLAYVDLEEAQRFFRMDDAVSGFEVRVNDIDQAPVVAKRIIETLGGF